MAVARRMAAQPASSGASGLFSLLKAHFSLFGGIVEGGGARCCRTVVLGLQCMGEPVNESLTSSQSVLVAGASWVAICGLLWKLFKAVDDVAAPEAKRAMATWLKSVDVVVPVRTIASTLPKAVDLVFGPEPWSWRCFWASCLASSALIISLCGLWLASGGSRYLWPGYPFSRFVIVVVFLILVLNVVPDYLSLVKSRYIIERLKRADRKRLILCALVADTLASGLLFVAWSFVVGIGTMVFHRGWHVAVVVSAVKSTMFSFIPTAVTFQSSGGPSPGLFMCSTLVMSIWGWIYGCSVLLLSVAPRIGVLWNFSQMFVDVNNKPFLVIGSVAIVIVTLFYVIILPMVIIL